MSVDEPQTDRELLLGTYNNTKELLEQVKDHECRIRCLEGGFWKMTGIAGFIGFVSGWASGIFGGR